MGIGVANGGWRVGNGLTASGHAGVWLREQREKEEKKELGIGLVVRGRVLNHKDAMTQKGHKEKSVKICLIREHIFKHKWRVEFGIGLVLKGKGFEPQRH